jgi:phage antirepressor YoqD-like protein
LTFKQIISNWYNSKNKRNVKEERNYDNELPEIKESIASDVNDKAQTAKMNEKLTNYVLQKLINQDMPRIIYEMK